MEEGTLVVRGRVEIDSRQPFKSVKEAVLLFGEKVLAGEVYANKLKEMGNVERANKQHGTKVGLVEEKLQTPEKTKDDEKMMAYYLMSLKQQLEETKSELNQLKSTRSPYPSDYTPMTPEIKEIKFIEHPKPTQVIIKPPLEETNEHDEDNLFESKQVDSVKFRTPSPTKGIVEVPKMQETSPSSLKIKKAKKKTLIPLLSGIFSKSKG